MKLESRIFVAGHRGLAGSAIVRSLEQAGYQNIIKRTHSELDLTEQALVNDFFAKEKPEYVFLAAATVGGIMANNLYRADFIYSNLAIQNNVIHASWKHNAKKLLFLGSSCIYPKSCPQPMKETHLLTSELEQTNEPYAIAKIAGLKMCEAFNRQYGTDFLSVMPTNLYGPHDNFNLDKSHLLPAFIRKFHLAKLYQQENWEGLAQDLGTKNQEETKAILKNHNIEKKSIAIWGTGKPRREFLHSDDLAEACVFLMKNDTSKILTEDITHQFINLGSGVDHTIMEIAEITRKIIGYDGQILTNPEKPDGTLQKLQDVSRIHSLGWKHQIELHDGIKKVYDNYLKVGPNPYEDKVSSH
jgi:GDP-L-fucose synthase